MTDEELDLSSLRRLNNRTEAVSVALLIMRHVFRNESFVALVDVMKDGCEWAELYGVTCFHNCTSL